MDPQQIVSVNCNHCGAALEVDEKARFVTCSYCHSQLAIQNTGSAVFTRVLEKIEQQTGQMAENLKVISLQNDLEQLDREWAMSRDDLMVSDRNASRVTPSQTGGVITIIISLVGGGAWTAFAAHARAPGFFLLFGILFIVVGVASGINSLNKAGELDTKRADYETRRQQLVNALEAERQQR